MIIYAGATGGLTDGGAVVENSIAWGNSGVPEFLSYTAPETPGVYTASAELAGVTGTAEVTVVLNPQTVFSVKAFETP